MTHRRFSVFLLLAALLLAQEFALLHAGEHSLAAPQPHGCQLCLHSQNLDSALTGPVAQLPPAAGIHSVAHAATAVAPSAERPAASIRGPPAHSV